MRSPYGLLVAGLLASGAAVLDLPVVASAHATTVAPLTVEQMTDAADLIVRGVVQDVWTDLDPSGAVVTYASVQVSESMKGYAGAGDLLTVESPGGVLAEGIANVELAARYSPGEEVFLFVVEKRFGTSFGTVGMFLGKYTIKQDPANGRPMVVRFTVPYTRPFDARFVPNPPPAERVSVEALRQQVTARIALGWDGQPIPGADPARLRTVNKLQPGVR